MVLGAVLVVVETDFERTLRAEEAVAFRGCSGEHAAGAGGGAVVRSGADAAADGVGEGFELPFIVGEQRHVIDGGQEFLRWRYGVDWIARD